MQNGRHPTHISCLFEYSSQAGLALLGSLFLYILGLGSPIESKAVGTVVTTRTTAMLVL